MACRAPLLCGESQVPVAIVVLIEGPIRDGVRAGCGHLELRLRDRMDVGELVIEKWLAQ